MVVTPEALMTQLNNAEKGQITTLEYLIDKTLEKNFRGGLTIVSVNYCYSIRVRNKIEEMYSTWIVKFKSGQYNGDWIEFTPKTTSVFPA